MQGGGLYAVVLGIYRAGCWGVGFCDVLLMIWTRKNMSRCNLDK